MRVLVACEYSGAVRDAFAALGHDAMSCDLLPSEKPGPHYVGDVRDVLGWGWDLMVAHPPCTYLSVSGMHWTVRGKRDPKLTDDALAFVRDLMAAPIQRKAIENPVSVISTRIRKPDQTIQPYQFGHDASKTTCLWLDGLPKLAPTLMIEGRLVCCGHEVGGGDLFGRDDVYGWVNCGGEKRAVRRWGNQTASGQNRLSPGADRWKDRSRTYPGIAAAMAAQWGGVVQ